jgi:hypothetical protein
MRPSLVDVRSSSTSLSMLSVFSYVLDDAGFDSRQRAVYFSRLQNVQTDSGLHSASCLVGARHFLPGIKRSECVDDHLHRSGAQVKNKWSYTSSPPLCSIPSGRTKGQLYVHLYSVM